MKQSRFAPSPVIDANPTLFLSLSHLFPLGRRWATQGELALDLTLPQILDFGVYEIPETL